MRKPMMLSYHGERHTISEWAKITGIPKNLIYVRINACWGIEQIFKKAETFGDSICWDCKNAVPGKQYGCSWSRNFKPVDGWEADKTKISRNNNCIVKKTSSYFVRKCPNFVPDEERKCT